MNPITLTRSINQLPTELIDHIYTFDYNHRKQMNNIYSELLLYIHNASMKYVLCELIEEFSIVCSNEYCEEYILQEDDVIYEEIMGHSYPFCCDRCVGEGGYWIRYDYRKSLRRQNKFKCMN